jgi:oxygen-independent coproporphyrinogen-3 oxidase
LAARTISLIDTLSMPRSAKRRAAASRSLSRVVVAWPTTGQPCRRDHGGVFGVYVHIPFCAARCDYCDFATWTDRAHLIDRYVDACVADVNTRDELRPATSIFFGGGTPSLLRPEQLGRILAAIPRVDDAEVTAECNPDSVDADKLRGYRDAGVNRLSFGVQSMSPHVLAALGRTHDRANVGRAVRTARDVGFENLNLDLIYGTPGETPSDWSATLDAALELEPDHLSVYALTVEPATPLGQRVAAGRQAAPDDDDQAAKYTVADERLTARGYEWYEISNWARPGSECRHNLLYWRQGEYAAIGCAAHGHTVLADGSAVRMWNVRTPERYLDRVAAGRSPESGSERLDERARLDEALTLALRTRDGGVIDSAAADAADELVEAGLLTRAGDAVALTRPGRLLANEVTVRLLPHHDRDERGDEPAGARAGHR